ncbi:MAG: ATP-dependent helicase [Desulfobacterales bacterium]|nr:ATP-dependent helicase [Desulfobacterales bacterium]MDJ0988847.1 ATP-dependent helicase [Desulfobacterales bacterium]
MNSSCRERFRRELNDVQYDAVFHDGGPLLVIAGAGSGKTRTLTYRAARLVAEGVSPERILLLTFTRKAAEEMLNRATRLLDQRCRHIAGGTFHSFAFTVLKRFAAAIGYPNRFTIIDRPDAESLIGMLLKSRLTGPRKGAIPRKKTLADIFSKAANKDQPLEDVLFEDYPHFGPYSDDIHALLQDYTAAKFDQAFMDYDDLLTKLLHLLEHEPELKTRIADRYAHLMVDEYQDTNLIQARIVRHLAERHQRIMVVGDDSQSIYSFRGANFRNIMDFPELFPDTRVLTLEENYRSVVPILELTNELIAQAVEKYPKQLFSRRPSANPPRLVHTGSENSQSRFIVDKIRELGREDIVPGDIAVLFRAGFHAFDLEVELAREGIAFVKYGGFKFMESAHIKDVLAHMRVVANPYDRLSWFRILLLINKIGPKSAQRLYDEIVRQSRGLGGFTDAAPPPKPNPGLEQLRALLGEIGELERPPVEIGERILAYYHPLLKERYDDHPKRWRDLEQLLVLLEKYDRLAPFLSDMTLEPPNVAVDNTFGASSETREDRLVLSTVHSAKGLEWHTVFIIWAMDGRFPSFMASESPEALDEELRLMYVAATRARENLFFLCPGQVFDRVSGMVLSRPSRFIDSLPEDLLHRESADIW